MESNKIESKLGKQEDKVYAEFIRQKYSKYHHQYPRWTDQLIYSKI